MATIQASMQLIDRVSKPLQNINAVLQKTINLFGNAQNAVSAFENQLANLTDIKISPIKITALIEDTRMSVSVEPIIDIQDTLPYVELPMLPAIPDTLPPIGLPVFPTVPDTLPPIGLPVFPTIPDTLPPIKQPVIPTWQSDNSIQIFDTSGVERYKQEVSSAQSMMERLSSIQANIAIKANDTKLFPPNMSADMESSYQRIIKISKAMSSLSNQKIDSAGANKLNNSIESVRANINQAITAQNALNNAMKSMDISSANSAYQKLVSNISIAETSIRDNISKQSEFNRKIQQGGTEASNLANKIKGCVGAYLSIAGLKTGIENTVGEAMNLDQQKQTLNAMFGNASVGSAYFEQLQEYALDTGQSMAELTTATRRFIGYTKNTEKLMNFNKIAQKMAIYDPEQGVQGAAYALNEALSGSYTSLKQRFEMSSADIDPLKDAVKSGSIDRIQTVLNDMMAAKNITDEVLAAFQDTAAFKFNNVVKEFKIKLADAGKASLEVVEPMIEKVSNWLSSTGGTAMINGITTSVYCLVSVLDIVITKAMEFGSFVADNWSTIAPLILGIVGCMAIYNAGLLISKGMALASAVAEAIHTKATLAHTTAQWGLNAAFLASPLGMTIGIIIAIIAVIYIVVAALNTWAGTSISATGIIMGVLAVLGAAIANIFIAAYNLIVGTVIDIWNLCASFGEFLANFARDPIGSTCRLFVDLADFVLGILETLAKAIDTLFGSNLANTVSGWRGNIKAWSDEVIGEPQIKAERFDKTQFLLEGIDPNDAWNSGYNLGANLEDKFKMPKFDEFNSNRMNLDDWNSGQSDTLNSISDDTKGIKDSVDMSEEDLKYLRDIAEMEVVNSFTTAEIKVSMSNNNTINSALDLDGITSTLTDVIYEQMQVAAEGVYN